MGLYFGKCNFLQAAVLFASFFLLTIQARQASCFSVPDTGQTSCYNNTNSIPCPSSVHGSDNYDFYGQDGNYLINPQNYRKMDANGNIIDSSASDWAAVYDNSTGLVWEVKTAAGEPLDMQDSDQQFSFNSGEPYSVALNNAMLAGRSSWKIPTIQELSTLLNYEDPAAKIDRFFFPRNSTAHEYWSSTLYNLHDSAAQVVSFADGSQKGSVTTNGEHLRAVSVWQYDRQEEVDHFIDNGDGTVTDTATGLMWMQATADIQGDGNPYATYWRQALSWCFSSTFGGYSDWRLPNISELRSLLEYSGNQPFINTLFFPDTDSNPYWSSTTEPTSPDKAWFVNFNNMANWYDPKAISTHHMLRAVRGGQKLSLQDNLTLYAPRQGDEFYVGEPIEIDWNKNQYPGPVDLLISRDGGRSFTVFKENYTCPENTNYYWVVTGPSSANCAIRIRESANHDNAATQSLFSIRDPQALWITTRHYNIGAYETILNISNSNGTFRQLSLNPFLEFTSSDPTVADYPRYYSLLEDLQNGWVEISIDYGPYQDNYSQGVFIFGGVGTEAAEPNNTTGQAQSAAEVTGSDNLYTSSLPENDIDFYTFTLATPSLVEIGYQTNSMLSDTALEILDSSSLPVASETSTNGEMLHFSLGLPAGDYFIKLSPNGDTSSEAWHMIAWKNRGAFSLPATPVEMDFSDNASKSASIGNLLDESTRLFSFSLTEQTPVSLQFTPPGAQADYLIQLMRGEEVLESVESVFPTALTLNSTLAPGDYTIRVTAISRVAASALFTISISESAGQTEQEPNDQEAEATFWQTASPISGRFQNETDSDIYVFDNTIPRYLELTFSCPVSNRNFKVSLFKDSLSNKVDGMETTTGEDVSLHIGLTKGTYFLKVVPSGPAETNYPYTLALGNSAQIRMEIESNNTILFANGIGDGLSGHRRGRIYSVEDVDYFAFSHSQSDFHIEFFPSATNGDYRISLVDENGEVVLNESGTPMSANSIDGEAVTNYDTPLNYTSMPDGDYFIKIEPQPDGDIDQYNIYDLVIVGGIGVTPIRTVVAIEISSAESNMDPNSTLDLTATAYYSDGSVLASPLIHWESSDTDVADVDGSGLVTSTVLGGSTTIVASILGVVGKIDITVDSAGNRQHPGNLILVAGGGDDLNDPLFHSTQYLADLVYDRFKHRFFSDRDIFYLNPIAYHDIDGDGYDNNVVDDLTPTVTDFGTAITTWATAQDTEGPLYIYLIDHGGMDSFKINEGVDGILSSAAFKEFLNSFRNLQPQRKIVIVVEACKSGSFTGNIIEGAEDMIIVTSTGEGDTYIQRDGLISFSQFFTDQLLVGATIAEAYTATSQSLLNQGPPYSAMEPQLYLGNGSLAAGIVLGGNFGIGSPFPQFTSIIASAGSISAYEPFSISAQVADLDSVQKVWAVVQSPAYVTPSITADLQAPEVNREVDDYLLNPDTSQYELSFINFKYNGEYSIFSYAMNSGGHITQEPVQTIVSVINGEDPLLPPRGDVDGDNAVTLDDAIICLQEISGNATGLVRQDYMTSGCDVNGDTKLGLAEAIYLLKGLSGAGN